MQLLFAIKALRVLAKVREHPNGTAVLICGLLLLSSLPIAETALGDGVLPDHVPGSFLFLVAHERAVHPWLPTPRHRCVHLLHSKRQNVQARCYG